MEQQSSYESLRSWYLAKLRKSAIESQISGQLTPSALIAADREVIEKLIAERVEPEEIKAKPKAASLAVLLLVLSIWLFLLVAVFASLFLYSFADPASFGDVFIRAANPASFFKSDIQVAPSAIVLIVVQLVLYVYPVCLIPYALLSKPR